MQAYTPRQANSPYGSRPRPENMRGALVLLSAYLLALGVPESEVETMVRNALGPDAPAPADPAPTEPVRGQVDLEQGSAGRAGGTSCPQNTAG